MTAVLDRPQALFGDSIVRVEEITRSDCNNLLALWQHPLGPCHRPFGQDHWLLICRGRPVALAVSASIVSSTIRDATEATRSRREVVELARIARSPDDPWALRVMLRLWREELAAEWPHWPARLLVSYALPGTSGDLYRFDGWTRVRTVKPASPGNGSTWARGSRTDTIGDGRKTLWTYDAPQRGVCGAPATRTVAGRPTCGDDR